MMPPRHSGDLLKGIFKSKSPKSEVVDNVPNGGGRRVFLVMKDTSVPRIPNFSNDGKSHQRPNATIKAGRRLSVPSEVDGGRSLEPQFLPDLGSVWTKDEDV